MQKAGSDDPHEMATLSTAEGLPNALSADDSTDVVLLRRGEIVFHNLNFTHFRVFWQRGGRGAMA